MAEHTDTPVSQDPFAKIAATCAEAGLEVMDQVLGIVWNREEVPTDVLVGLDAAEVYDLYESFIGPAIDRLSGYLQDRAETLSGN